MVLINGVRKELYRHFRIPSESYVVVKCKKLTVISRKFLIKYYKYSFDYLIIIMNQLRLTLYLVYSTVCSLLDTDLQNLLSSYTPTPPQDNSDRSLIAPVGTC